MVTRVATALRESPRAALVTLTQQLAVEIDSCANARDRLALVQAFLRAVAQLEASEATARREARLAARSAPPARSGAATPLDELLARRERRRGRV